LGLQGGEESSSGVGVRRKGLFFGGKTEWGRMRPERGGGIGKLKGKKSFLVRTSAGRFLFIVLINLKKDNLGYGKARPLGGGWFWTGIIASNWGKGKGG